VTTSTRTGNSLVKATLAIHEPPVGAVMRLGAKIKDVDFQFNPSQLVLSKSAQWTTRIAPKFRFAATPQFNGAEPYTLQIQILLDSSMKPSGTMVQDEVEALLSCCEVTSKSIAAEQPCTPWVFFQWGSFSTASFIAYVNSVQATYTLFNPSGTPIRATCDLTITQIPQVTKGQNPTSGSLESSRTHRVAVGDTLASLAWREYGDATTWRAIARANDIDDPMRLQVGTELLIPASASERPKRPKKLER
jgi:nucleoid-associated protein YgaU